MAAATAALDGLASFDDDWMPEAYLREYYTEVQHDEQVTLAFLGEAAATIGAVSDLLEVGCGPTLHHVVPFAPTATRIRLADYLPANLDHVRRWADGADDAWDWSPFVGYTVGLELGRPASVDEIDARQDLLRRRITGFGLVDVRQPRPLLGRPRRYGAVLCCFCPDSITSDVDEWRRYTTNVASLVAPGGWFVLTALGGASSYRVGARCFPSAGVTARDVTNVLVGAGFRHRETTVITAGSIDAAAHGYESVVLAISRKM